MNPATVDALIDCGVIVLLICVVCFLVLVPMFRNAKMDPDRDKRER
jgi:hypothetical protein